MSGGRQLGKKFFRKVTNHRWGRKLCVTKKNNYSYHSILKKKKKKALPPGAAIVALLLG